MFLYQNDGNLSIGLKRASEKSQGIIFYGTLVILNGSS